MRALALLTLVLAGCGDDNATTAADMSAAVDLSGGSGPKSCGTTGVMASCATVSANVPCYICDFANGSGLCARPCSLLAPDCPTGQQCHELVNTGDGGAPPITTEGTCTNFGFCR